MDRKLRAWLLVLGVAVVCSAALGGIIWYRSIPLSTAAMYKRLAPSENMILYVDVNALRKSGILERLVGGKEVEDAEYQRFVDTIGFDYREHLNDAMVAFGRQGKFMLVRGQFNWRKLRDYATSQGGTCYAGTCRMTGSRPDRHISFLPIQNRVMGIIVAPGDAGTGRLTEEPSGPDADPPAAPIWLSIPGAVLRSGRDLPAGTRPFTRSIEHADRVVLTLGQDQGRIAVRMNVACLTEGEAAEVVSQLTQATTAFREMIRREGLDSSPGDFNSVLAGGTFRAEGLRAIGHWWIDDAFINNLWKGGVN